MPRLLLAAALLLLAGCPKPPHIHYVTMQGMEVTGSNVPMQAEIERWTLEVAAAFDRAECPELEAGTADQVLHVLKYSREQGVGARVKFVDKLDAYGYASGRMLTVGPLERAASFKHELTHALFDALVPAVPVDKHHDLMKRCSVP